MVAGRWGEFGFAVCWCGCGDGFLPADVGVEAVDGFEGVQEGEGGVDADGGGERGGGFVGEGCFEHGGGREPVVGWAVLC